LARRATWHFGGLVLLALALRAFCEPVQAQGPHVEGLPPIESFTPGHAGLAEGCLSSSHGPDGTLFVGSPEGLLDFDGSQWHLIHTPGHTQVRSVLVLKDGRIAWGATNEFGLCQPDARRDWQPTLLSDSLAAAGVHFREVRAILELEHGIYFQTAEFLARWHNGHLQLWRPGGVVGGMAAVRGGLYVQAEGEGLFRLNPQGLSTRGNTIPKGALEPVLGPELFQQGNRMVCLFPMEDGLLLGTRQRGLFHVKAGEAEEMAALNATLRPLQLFHGILLRDGRMALATLQGGLLLLDKQGHLLRRLAQEEGLPGPQVIHVSQDAAGDLWLASMDGLSRVGLTRPFTTHGADTGLRGRVESMTLHDGALVVGTTEGIFRLEEAKGIHGQARFVSLDLPGICWRLCSTPKALLALLGPDLVEVSAQGVRKVMGDQPTALGLDALRPDRALVAVQSGARLLQRQGAHWQEGPPIPGLQCNVTDVLCDARGLWWLATSDHGLLRLEERGGAWTVRQFGQAQGLPPGPMSLSLVQGTVMLVADGRCWEVGGQDSLQVCDWITPPDGWSGEALSGLMEKEGTVWATFRDGLASAVWRSSGELEWQPVLHPADGFHLGPLAAMGTMVCVGKGQELLLVKAGASPLPEQRFPLRVRKLQLGGLEWTGSAGGLRQGETIQGPGPLEVELACAAGSWDGLQLWSWRIKGLDEDWSAWSGDGKLRLPWLPGGDYVIQVRHRLASGPIQDLEVARIHVPLPWHAHWWVRSLATLLLLGVIHFFVRSRARRLQAHNDQLAAEVQERRLAEAALHVREARYRSLFEHAMDGILILDAQGRVQQANPAAQHILQLTETLMVGRQPDLYAPPTQPDGRSSVQAMSELLEAARQGVPCSTEWLHQRPDGVNVLLDVNISLLDDGEGAQVLAVVRDLSERRELEEKLRQSQKLEAVGRLAGGIAHDFNNILMVIQGQCDLIFMGPHGRQPEDPLREDLLQIRDASRRAADLTRQLLAFSRKQNLHPQQISINHALTDVERLLRRVLGEHIEIQLELGAGLQAVSVDPGQLDQVVVNLAVNARDAMPEGGRLTVSTANEDLPDAQAREMGLLSGRLVRLSMRDTGHGMDARTMAHIFEPFYTTKEPGKGTGLGLATVYGIITQSGGAIRVESQPGEGTVFHVYLPACAANGLSGGVADSQSLDELGGTERILLVEDEAAVREVLQRTLENNGYQVMSADDGQRALDILLRGEEVDLVLSDVVMPALGGVELAQALRTVGQRTPIILMTGYSDNPLDEPLCRELDLGVLMKPFGPRALLTELRQRLDAAGPTRAAAHKQRQRI